MQAMTEEKHEAKERPEDIERILMHEMGHCLGFGTTDVRGDLIKDFPPKYSHHDPHFDGLFAKSPPCGKTAMSVFPSPMKVEGSLPISCPTFSGSSRPQLVLLEWCCPVQTESN